MENEREIERENESERQREGESERATEREREREGEQERETERGRMRESDREGERQRGREREPLGSLWVSGWLNRRRSCLEAPCLRDRAPVAVHRPSTRTPAVHSRGHWDWIQYGNLCTAAMMHGGHGERQSPETAFLSVINRRARGNAPPESGSSARARPPGGRDRGYRLPCTAPGSSALAAAVPWGSSSFHCGVPALAVPRPPRTGRAPGLPRPELSSSGAEHRLELSSSRAVVMLDWTLIVVMSNPIIAPSCTMYVLPWAASSGWSYSYS